MKSCGHACEGNASLQGCKIQVDVESNQVGPCIYRGKRFICVWPIMCFINKVNQVRVSGEILYRFRDK